MVTQPVSLLAVTTMDKLQKIPPGFWIKVGAVVLAIIVITIVMRKMMGVNKFVLGGVVFVAGGIWFFNMVYRRTEPAFLTPMVDRIAPFFPTAGAYEVKQASPPAEDHGKKK